MSDDSKTDSESGSSRRGKRVHGKSHGRRLARRRALQAIYQQALTGASTMDVERHFREDQDLKGVDMDYFLELLHEGVKQQKELEEVISPHLDRAVESVDVIERVVLLLSAYELKARPDVPFRVVINEGVELAKDFAGENSHAYINGVLDKLVPAFRPLEAQAAKR